MSSKTEDEHIIAIITWGLLLPQSYWESTSFKNEKLQHLTFRTPEGVIKALKKEADSKGVPLSILVNQIFKNHLVQKDTGKADFVLSSKDFFRKIFEKIDQKSLEQYGIELGRAIVSEYTSSYFPDINSCTIVQFLESWFGRFQSFQHRVDEVNNRHSFSLNHDINMNFSIVLRVILEGLVEPVIKNKVVFGDLTPNTITFTFEI